MNKLIHIIAAGLITSASMNAMAWWNGPNNPENIHENNLYAPFPYAAPVHRFSPEQHENMSKQLIKAAEAQRKLSRELAEKHEKMLKASIEAHRQAAEEFAKSISVRPMQTKFAPVDIQPPQMQSREQMLKEMETLRENRRQEIDARRAQFQNTDLQTRGMKSQEALMKDREARRKEVEDMIKARRAEMQRFQQET